MVTETTYIWLYTKRALSGWACIIILLLLTCPASTVEPAHIKSTADTPSEYELKAIYLYNFLKFVQWPKDSCKGHNGRSHQIGVLGDSSFNQVLIALQQKLKEKDQALEVTFYGSYHKNMELPECCLLFISGTESKSLPNILDQLAGKPVLTVADTYSFMGQGVMITLVSRKNKIRWAINRLPVAESRLKISAKLLDIAVKVID